MMNYVLLLMLLLLLVLTVQTSSEDNEARNRTSCPKGTHVHSNQDDTLTFFTDNSQSYDKVWLQPTRSRLPVRVRAFKDAHFKLQTSNASFTCEVVLGASLNTRADIRVPGIPALKETTVCGLLRQEEFVPVVIAWNSSRIVVTRGSNDSDVLIEWSDPAADIEVLKIGLAGYGFSPKVEGEKYLEEYQFQETDVSSFSVKTPARYAYKRFQRTFNGQQGQRFNLTTAEEASIAFLASGDSDFNQPTYKLLIGTQSNTHTILYYRGHRLLLINHTPAILSDREQREFWVAWKDGRFAFGVGSEFYQNSRLVSPDSTVLERFHSMAVDSTQQATWNFVVQDFDCVEKCQIGWYSDWKTGDCRKCSTQISNCFSCTQDQSSERPICSECANGTVMLGEGGECLQDCPPHIGYTPDYGKRKCVCTYGSCCGPAAFRFCFQVLPCLLVVLVLTPVLVFAFRRLRRLHIIDPQRISIDQLSMILKLIPPHVVENLYVENINNQQVLRECCGLNDPMETLLVDRPDETSFYLEVQASEENADTLYFNTLQSARLEPQNRGLLPRPPVPK